MRPLEALALGAFGVATGALTSCGGTSSTPPSPSGSCESVEIVAAGSNYSESVVCGAPVCTRGPGTSGVDLGDDPQLTESGGRAFFLARTNDFVFELDPRCGAAVRRFDVAAVSRARGIPAANPHDVAAAPDGSAWVVLYNVPAIAVVADGAVVHTIDLSSYDPDGNPEAESIRIVDVGGAPKAFVALERLTFERGTFRSKLPSHMLRIDVATRTVEAEIPLEGRNPFNPMREDDGVLFLAEPGNFDDAAEPQAGIERFDTRTSTTTLLVPERELGGSVAEVAVSGGCGAAIVAGPEPDVNPTSLVTFDATTGALVTRADAPAFGPTPGYDLQGLTWRGRSLYVGDRRATGTGYPVRVFERESDTSCAVRETSRTIELPLPPVSLRSAQSAATRSP